MQLDGSLMAGEEIQNRGKLVALAGKFVAITVPRVPDKSIGACRANLSTARPGQPRSIAVSSNLHPAGFDELIPKTLATATATVSCTMRTSAKPAASPSGSPKPSPARESPR